MPSMPPDVSLASPTTLQTFVRSLIRAVGLAAIVAVAGCALFYRDHEAERRSEERRQQAQIALDGYYRNAVQAGTLEAEQEFAVQCAIYADNAFHYNPAAYPQPTDADRAQLVPFVDKAAALLEARIATSPDHAAQMMLRRADLFRSAARWPAALAEIRRVLALPELDVATVLGDWITIGVWQHQPATILEACRTLGPRTKYDYALLQRCVEDGAGNDVDVGLAWASEADRARFRTDAAAWRGHVNRENDQLIQDTKRESCRGRCGDHYQQCLNGHHESGNECSEQRKDCVALCTVRYGK